MKKYKIILIYLTVMSLFIVGCSNTFHSTESNIEEKALKEDNKIAYEEGYSLKSESFIKSDVLVEDERVLGFIKDVCIEGGYSEDTLNYMTKEVRFLEYELKEKSKFDQPINLCIVVDKEKAIGAYLDYVAYSPSIAPINFTENFK